MRILLLAFNTVGKGTYRRAFQFGRQLAKRGHAVTLIATSRERRAGIEARQVDGLTLVESPDFFTGSLRSGWDLWNVLHRIAWLRRRPFDLVHAFEARPTVLFPALYLQRRRRVPLIMDWADWFGHGGSVEERTNRLVRAALRPVETFFEETFRRWADGTTVICTTLRERAIALGVPSESIVLLPNGSDIEHLQPIEHAAARRRLGLPVEGLWLGYVGSIFPRDAQLMARAFDSLCAQGLDVRLLMIGYCPLDLRQCVKNPQRVIQTGYVPEESLNDYLASAHICWLPLCDSNANRGRWPLKLNDYMAVGRPTVATAVGDVPALFEQEAIGFLSADEPEAFAMQTARLLRDLALQATMGQRARQVAETRFNWARLTDDLEILYQRTVYVRSAFSRSAPSTYQAGGLR